jgi:hypothetical protein
VDVTPEALERALAVRYHRIRDLASREALLAPVVAAFAAFVVLLLPNEVWSDSWLALAAGRDIVAHGLPAHDGLTVWAHGHRWVDQQWLAQLAFYGAYALGGLRLALLFHALAAAGAFAGAVAAARARGGSVRSVLLISVVVFFAFGFFVLVMRPQSLAYPLFVALFWLLVRYARGDTRRLWLVAPLLVVWANAHGTVALASLLVLLAVASTALGSRALGRRDVGLAAAALVLPFASPYALDLPGYYHRVLFNPQFGQYVAEWRATTPTLLTYAFYALAVVVVLLLGRNGRSVTRFEQLALLVLLALAFKATRGVPWFCLAGLMTAPAMLRDVLKRDYDRVRGSRLLLIGATSALILLATLVAALSKPRNAFELNYPPAARAAVVAGAGPHGLVYANETYADWLVLTHPSLRGRVAFDARFELLSSKQLRTIAAVRVAQVGWAHVLRPYAVAVLRSDEDDLRRAMLAAGWTIAYHRAHIDVLRR